MPARSSSDDGCMTNSAPTSIDAGPHTTHRRNIALATAGYVVSFVLSLVLQSRMNRDAAIFTPYSTDDTVVRYLSATVRGGAAYGAFFQAVSACALLILAVCLARYARELAPSAGYADMIRAGGSVSATLLLVSSSLQWVSNRPGTGGDLRVFRAISDSVFITGAGPHVAALGLMVGAFAWAGLKTGALPQWLSWPGLLIAAASVLSLLSLLVEPATIFIPIGRYIGMVWFLGVATSVLLRRTVVGGR